MKPNVCRYSGLQAEHLADLAQACGRAAGPERVSQSIELAVPLGGMEL